MDLPASVLVSFSDTLETRICGREDCQRPYITCTQHEKSQWERVTNTRNTNGVITRWVCGDCMRYYASKNTTHRRGAKLHLFSIELLTDFLLFRCDNSYQHSRTIQHQPECCSRSERKRYNHVRTSSYNRRLITRAPRSYTCSGCWSARPSCPRGFFCARWINV